MDKIETFNKTSFGSLITNFRKNLNLTQEEFGSLILTSRITNNITSPVLKLIINH